MRRRDLLLAGAALVTAGPAAAQSARKFRRVATLGNLPPSDSAARAPWDRFLATLGETGWLQGETLAVEARWATGRPDRYPQLADELIAWCRQKMANYKVPRYVEVVDALPLNASGKVLKYELREKAAAQTVQR